jgi:ABC transporter, ATP-binding protein
MVEAIIECIIPILMAMIVDKGIKNSDLRFTLIIGGAMVLLTGVSLFFGILAGKFSAQAASGFAKNVRHDMFENIQRFSFSNIDKFSTPSLIIRLTTDLTFVKDAFHMIIRILFRAPALFIFSLIMTFSISPMLSLIFLIVGPLLALGLYVIIIKAHPIFEKVFKKYDLLDEAVQENLRSMRTVKSFVREEYEANKFKERNQEIYQNFVKAEKILAFNLPIMQGSMYICILLISWIGAHLITSSSMTTGQLMSMFTYTMQILMALIMVSNVFVMVIISRASAERIVEVLDEKSDLENPENGIKTVDNGDIVFDNVSFSYAGDKNKLCLKNLNLHIKSGQVIGIIGSTGSAKTSFVQLLPRLYDVTEGRLLIAGHDVREYDLESLRHAVAIVLQKNVLFSGSIKENLRWGNENATDDEIKKACQLACIDDFVEGLENQYDTYIEQGGSNVSGGQRQRLCIARAILTKPKILILDDSTSAVDTKTDARIRKAFKTELANTTKLIIAQRAASVMDADQIVVLDNGTINAVGTHEQLLDSCVIYKEVYTSQLKGASLSE